MTRTQMALQSGTTPAFEDPPLAKFLFSNPGMAWAWLPLRIWLGWMWLEPAWHKLNDPAWMGNGSALKAFWERAIVTQGKPPVAFDWYRDFLSFMVNAGAYTW